MTSHAIHDYPQTDATQAMSDGLTLVDFWAPWCGPCRMMHPVLEKLAAGQDAAAIVKINIDENPELAGQYGVSAIPTLVLLSDGRELRRFVGLQQHTDLMRAIQDAARAAGKE